MSITTPECQRCRTRMERGFIVDHSHAERVVSQWAPGEPRKSFWSGMKLDKSELLPVATFRCPKCGFLESYADKAYAAT